MTGADQRTDRRLDRGIMYLLVAAAALGVGLGLVVVPGFGAPASSPASQQLRLERSAPADGAQLAEAPAGLRLWFSSPPEPAVSLIRLAGPGGAVELGEVRKGEEDSLVVPVAGEMIPGTYRVTWRTSLGGGRPARGTFEFELLAR